ncbi:MAG: protein-L-isoaspartate(D-aspartate) O-methyltransferase [Candidatus Omnitrophica bacterium]|nr:protein-L-isoaspartate(D-aspartate) O-methyltransferase [Candidatus Omnitrophota bacterium]
MSFEAERERMVQEQLQARGIAQARVLAAFRKVPRQLFVPADYQREAYADHPIPIDQGQTISQPFIVALMVSSLRLHGHERVLEIGTGSGYQTAILAELALEVYSIERIPELCRAAKQRLASLGYLNVHAAPANGSLGWPEAAPYDAIIVSAAAPDVPQPLLEQLAPQGRMVLPVGSQHSQMLVEVERRNGAIVQRPVAECVFVPLVGQFGWSGDTSS